MLKSDGALRVLLVEDSRILAEQLEEALVELPGVEVTSIQDSCASALSAIEAEAPQVVILDLLLKDSTGFDVLRSLPDRPHRPIVFVISSLSGTSVRRECLHLGADGFFEKCGQIDDLLTRVEALRLCVA